MKDEAPMQNEHHEGSDGVGDIARAGSMLRAAIPPLEFREGFSDRIMQQLAASGVQQSPDVLRFDAIERGFRMLAAAAAVAIVALSAHNTVITRVADTSFIDAAIGLQPVSAESILSYPSEALQ
jgi:hypothetical protein